jgi:SAM-dependent methyltransferase
MALIAFNQKDAAAFAATRHLSEDGLAGWREAVTEHVRPGMHLLDLGAGTGSWSRAFTGWFPGLRITAVEPSPAMAERAVFQPILPGDATRIPLPDDTADAVWISTVIHHVADLEAAAAEIRRVLKPGGPVLIRSVFAGRPDGVTLFRYFPEAVGVLNEHYPSVPEVEAAFATAGFARADLKPILQTTAPSLREATTALRRAAHTPLQLITDDAYETGLRRMQEAAQTEPGPVVDALDLLVLR